MKKNRTYIIRWDKEPTLFKKESFEKRFGKGISDEREMLMPYFSLHVYDMSTLDEGDSFYLFDNRSLVMKGLILSKPYRGYKGDSDQYFADIYPEFACHPDSDNALTLSYLEESIPGILEKEGELEKADATALDEAFTEYRNRICPIDSDFSASPLAISSHVRFPALTKKNATIIEKVDYRRYLQCKSRITEGYTEYQAAGLTHFRINIHNFRLVRSFFAILKCLYGNSTLSILFGLSDEDYCENDGLTAEEAESYLEKERRSIEENTLFSLLARCQIGDPAECVYMTPEKEVLVSTGDAEKARMILKELEIEKKDNILFMSQFITEESMSLERSYKLVDDIADALPGTMYFGDDDEEEED